MPKYSVSITFKALQMLEEITDRRIQQKIKERIQALAEEPQQQGKPLLGELANYRSVRAAQQRYRIIYRIEKEQIVVLVIAVGLRQDGSKHDIYTLTKKMIRLQLLESE